MEPSNAVSIGKLFNTLTEGRRVDYDVAHCTPDVCSPDRFVDIGHVEVNPLRKVQRFVEEVLHKSRSTSRDDDGIVSEI